MKNRAGAPLLVLVLAACGGPGGIRPAPALAYRVPTPATVDYVSGDTARIQIEAAGQRFAVRVDVAARWRMAFEAAAQGVRVTATLSDLDARLSNPFGAAQTADESAVQGPMVFTLDDRGRATVLTVPTIKPLVAQFINGHGIAQGFFPRLPGRVSTSGTTWTDTVSYETDEAGARTAVESVTTYTAIGDTVAGGATYLLVRSIGTTTQSSTGAISGAKFSQRVGGTTAGHFLWDAAAAVVHELEYRSELTGTMEVAVAPVPLAVTVTSTIRQRRVLP